MCPRSLSVRVAEARQDCGCRSLPGIELFPSSCNLAAVVTQANSCSYWGGAVVRAECPLASQGPDET